MDQKHDRSSYPKPFIVEARQEHRQSLILLHGRGSNGEDFGKELLESPISPKPGADCSLTTIAATLQNTRFIFPTARKRRAKSYNRATINQWFDNVPLTEQDNGASQERPEWQLEGLKQSREFLQNIVDEEVTCVGARNVFVGGLSQGCAMGLHLLLSCEVHQCPLGGFVGMSGWLPFVEEMEEILRPPKEGAQFAVSETDFDHVEFVNPESASIPPSESSSPCSAAAVCNFVRDNMDLLPIAGSQQPPWLQTPVFLGHGSKDDKVKATRGRRAAQFLKDVGVEVIWKEYDEGHWYKVPEEIEDIVAFLQNQIVVEEIAPGQVMASPPSHEYSSFESRTKT